MDVMGRFDRELGQSLGEIKKCHALAVGQKPFLWFSGAHGGVRGFHPLPHVTGIVLGAWAVDGRRIYCGLFDRNRVSHVGTSQAEF